MRRGRWCLGLLLALSLGVASANAQSTGSSLQLVFGNGVGTGARIVDVPVKLSGALTVSFRGEERTGCATQGLCGYSGTVIVRPGSGVEIVVARSSHHGHATYQAELALASGPVGAVTASHVARAGGGVCSDAEQPGLLLQATVTHAVVSLPFLQPGGTLLANRCAGPLDGDLTGAGPQLRLPVAELLAGRRMVDLSGTWSFAAGGLAGTATSTLRLALQKPVKQRGLSAPKFPAGIRTRLVRQVTEILTARGEGQLNLAVTGDPSSCEFLDSCGLGGSETSKFDPQSAVGSLTVFGPAVRPYRDFLAALGISRQGNPRGLQAEGSVSWTGGGTVSSKLDQGTSCTSLAPASGGIVLITGLGSRLDLTYTSGPLRTRCPGPTFAQDQILASGVTSLRQLASGAALRLTGGGRVTDDGYVIQQHTSLSLTLHRGRLRQQTFLEPTG